MAFNFEVFFGYEQQINSNPDLVLIYGFAGIVFGIIAMLLLALILRKIGLTFIISNLLNPMILSFLICIMIAIPPTILFKMIANDLSGVKLIYIWLSILVGIHLFTFMNFSMIKKWIYSFSETRKS